MAELASPAAPGTVVLTFDDGFADFASGALPALVERGWPATLYVTTGAIGSTTTWLPENRPMLSWSALDEIVAEGVENDEQRLMLRTIGCDTLQGYHLGRPVSATEIAQRFTAEPAARSIAG